MIREIAEETNMFHMSDRWLGGTLTNNRVIMTRTRRLKELREMEANGAIDDMPNKEASRARRELSKLERTLAGIADMRKLPAAMVVVDIERDDIAVREGNKLNIPIVAVVDSNCDPDPIDHVIPGNDDAVRSIRVLVDALAAAVKEGLVQGNRQDEEPLSTPADKPKATEEAPAEPVTEEAATEAEAPAEKAPEDQQAEPPPAAEEQDTAEPPQDTAEEPAAEEPAAQETAEPKE